MACGWWPTPSTRRRQIGLQTKNGLTGTWAGLTRNTSRGTSEGKGQMTATVVAHIHAHYPRAPVTRECTECGAKLCQFCHSVHICPAPTDTTKED